MLNPEEAEHQELMMDGLRESEKAIAYFVGRRLAELYPDKAVVQTKSPSFDLRTYAHNGLCTTELASGRHSEIDTTWYGEKYGIWKTPANATYSVEWKSHTMTVVMMQWPQGHLTVHMRWIIADTTETAEEFLKEVSEFDSEVRSEILVFEDGCFQKSKELFDSVTSTTFENLILPPAMKKEIQDDFHSFFNAREEYERYGVPWKRGVLFHGAPGNGKTHTLKALINWLGQPCLYVKSFKAQYSTDHSQIREVFERARKTTPCLLVLEDLDSLINDKNRSFFLNEMDGFAANTGIVVLATTNNPERLDPAILERPSRFDRKYAFGLPTPEERKDYLTMWNDRSEPELRMTDAGVESVVAFTDGFSFAYLKELWLSSMMRWIETKEAGAMDGIVTGQIGTLIQQMNTPITDPGPMVDEEYEGDDE